MIKPKISKKVLLALLVFIAVGIYVYLTFFRRPFRLMELPKGKSDDQTMEIVKKEIIYPFCQTQSKFTEANMGEYFSARAIRDWNATYISPINIVPGRPQNTYELFQQFYDFMFPFKYGFACDDFFNSQTTSGKSIARMEWFGVDDRNYGFGTTVYQYYYEPSPSYQVYVRLLNQDDSWKIDHVSISKAMKMTK